jgi:hypothetical protein
MYFINLKYQAACGRRRTPALHFRIKDGKWRRDLSGDGAANARVRPNSARLGIAQRHLAQGHWHLVNA